MRKLLAGATFVAFGVSAAAHGALNIKGSDTLEEVTRDVINVCDLGSVLTYIGGGSTTGEAAMTAGAQQISPMSRELRGAACSATASQLLIGLDGLAIVASNQLFGDSLNQTSDVNDDCSDSISGGPSISVPGCTAADGCSPDGTYTFTNWKDVLALIYGGQNHTAATQLNPDKTRNPLRINCAGALRQAVLNNYATIFADSGTEAQSCRSSSCIKLKHAFRRGDSSGTTDTFVTLVGLINIPNYTTTFALFSPTKDTGATVNPFCNAGSAKMNKGDSDYLDLDPVRRIADSENAANGRLGLEQVSQGFAAPSNPPLVIGIDDRVEPAVTVLDDFGSPSAPNVWPDPNVANSVALQKAAMPQRRGLGVVLPVEIPGNYANEQVAYFSSVPFDGEPTICTPGKFAPTIPDAQHPSAVCPNGGNQPCLLPVFLDASNPSAPPNFNCLSNGPIPALLPLRDERAFNLMVVDATGKYVRDNFLNPSLPTLSAVRQNRVVSAYFRLHISQVTHLGGNPTGINCKKLSSTDQIGCLVSANPCSIGFAGRESVDNVLNMAFQVEGIQPTAERISNLVNGLGQPFYPISRTLWLNSNAGFGATTGDQLSLLQCFRGQVPGVSLGLIDDKVQGRNFVKVPANITNRTKNCPAVFP